MQARSEGLHTSCERLAQEHEQLVHFCAALSTELNYFGELERISKAFHGSSLDVAGDNFLPLLKRLEECIVYAHLRLAVSDLPDQSHRVASLCLISHTDWRRLA